MSTKFLLLMSVTKASANDAKKVLANLKESVDSGASPLWIDAMGVGVFLESDLVASEIWNAAFTGTRDFNDALIVELGGDWAARREAKTTH